MKKQNQTKLLCALLCLTLIFAGCSGGDKTSEEVAPTSEESIVGDVAEEALPISRVLTVTNSYGTAFLFSADSPEKLLITDGMTITEKDIIITEDGSTITLSLDDTKNIYVAPNTEFAVSSLDNSDGENTILALKHGNLINEINEPLSEQDSYEVHTKNLVMSITGTIASVTQGSDSSNVSLFDGSGIVEMKGEADSQYPVNMGERLYGNLENIGFSPISKDTMNTFENEFVDGYEDRLDALKDQFENAAENYQAPGPLATENRRNIRNFNDDFAKDYLNYGLLNKGDFTDDFLNDNQTPNHHYNYPSYSYPSYSYPSYSYPSYSYHSYNYPSTSYHTPSYDYPSASYHTPSYDYPSASYHAPSYSEPSYDYPSYSYGSYSHGS